MQLFRDGQAAFEKQDYCTALSAYEGALSAGRTGPAVHFNIGVAAYRCGSFDRAQPAFEEAARTPSMASLAHYNLGLVALARQQDDDARDWFSRVERDSSDERLRGLAAAQLSGLPVASVSRDWIAYGAFSAGYDDNVALIASSDSVGISNSADAFADLQIAISAPVSGPWQFDASMFLVNYADLDAFDQLGVQGGGRYEIETGAWSHQAGAQLAYTTLDGSGFERAASVSWQSATAITASWRFRARYRFLDTEGLDEFEGLTGTRHELALFMDSRGGQWTTQVGYRFDDSSYQEPTLSATRHQFGFETRRALAAGWTTGVEALWRLTHYHLDSAGEERRLEIAIEASRPLSQRWHVILRYAYANNDADQPEYNYDRNRISAGIEAVW